MSRLGRIRALIDSTISSVSNGLTDDRPGNSPSAKPGAKIQLYRREPSDCGLMILTRGTPGAVIEASDRSTVRRTAISNASLRNASKAATAGAGCDRGKMG